MESVKKTFRIPELLLKKWTAALRSGEYQQGKHALYKEQNNTYCCLGVLMKVCDGTIQDTSENPEITQLPKAGWAAEHGITDLRDPHSAEFTPLLGARRSASQWNDTYYATFPQIADMLEQYAETY